MKGRRIPQQRAISLPLLEAAEERLKIGKKTMKLDSEEHFFFFFYVELSCTADDALPTRTDPCHRNPPSDKINDQPLFPTDGLEYERPGRSVQKSLRFALSAFA